ncbi:unnamed protein product, partial [Brassica oleracea]
KEGKEKEKKKINKFRALFGEARHIKLRDFGNISTESRRRFGVVKKGLVPDVGDGFRAKIAEPV